MATTVRRRLVGKDMECETASETASETSTSREASPDNQRSHHGPPEATSTIKVIHKRPKTRKRKTTAIFLLGSLFGIIAAGFFAKSNDLIDLPIPEFKELSMDSLFDVLPAGFVKEMRDLVVSENNSGIGSFAGVGLSDHLYRPLER